MVFVTGRLERKIMQANTLTAFSLWVGGESWRLRKPQKPLLWESKRNMIDTEKRKRKQ